MLAITSIRDVAERKRAEEERARLHGRLEATPQELGAAYEKAKELERVKTQLFANVSHELRTPLALIVGPADELLASELPAEARRQVGVIARNARTLSKHVNDLLDVSKLEAGKMALKLSDVDVAHLVRLVAAHFEGSPPSESCRSPSRRRRRSLRASIRRSSSACSSTSSRTRSSSRPPGGASAARRVRRRLPAPPSDAGFAIEVANSGPGVGGMERESVFARFARGEDEATRRAGGTGLGLAIAKEFVELHAGRIELGDAPEGGAGPLAHGPR
jgi:signal transduction histidine kinase